LISQERPAKVNQVVGILDGLFTGFDGSRELARCGDCSSGLDDRKRNAYAADLRQIAPNSPPLRL
jgi:hypothetical protein